MKKFLLIVSLIAVLSSLFCITALATDKVTENSSTCQGCEICNPTPEVEEEMPPMKVKIDVDAFVSSLGLMGKGMFGIFVVTLVIIGVVATLNWHGKSLEARNEKRNK